MSSFEYWCRLCPAATISTALFILIAGWSVLFRRKWVVEKFAAPPPTSHVYYGALDSYRGFAACLVAFAHMVFWCYPVFYGSKDVSPYLISYGGNKAVPIFVILSGFLIFRSVRKIDAIGSLRDYTRRRFLRIFPLYFATAIAVIAIGQMAPRSMSNVLSELFMLRSLSYPTFVNPPAWSLYVEVCFYIFLPVYVLATGRWVTLASLGAFVVLTLADAPGARELHLWKFFFVGILVSWASDRLSDVTNRYGQREVLALAIAAFGVYLLVYDFKGKDWFSTKIGIVPKDPKGYTLGLALGFGLLVVGSLSSRLISTIVAIWPLRFLGTISYSIYLVHPFYLLAAFPPLRFVGVGQPQEFLAPIGVAPAWYGFFVFFPGILLWSSITYLLIERPAQTLGWKKQQPEPRTLPRIVEEPTSFRRAA